MIFELKIALRFLKSGRTQTAFIVGGIALGVAVLIFLSALITSLQNSLVEQTIGNSSHITIKSGEDAATTLLERGDEESVLLRGNYSPLEKKLNNWPLIIEEIQKDSRVKAISPTLFGTGLARSAGQDKSIQIKGIRFDDADPIYDISSRMIEGTPSVEGNAVLIGTKLSEDLGIKTGGILNILMPSGERASLLVGGVFDLENETVNETLIFMDLSRAQKLLNSGSGITSIEVQINDPFEADVLADEWRSMLNGVSILQWKEQNKQLLTALTSQSSSSYTIQFFVLVAVTFGISSVLAVSVIQKAKEIGILKAMGTTKKSASRIFILQGLMLGFLGSVLGILFGILLLEGFRLAGNALFVIEYQWGSFFAIAVIAMVAGALASVVPARNSANLNPMEAIKNG